MRAGAQPSPQPQPGPRVRPCTLCLCCNHHVRDYYAKSMKEKEEKKLASQLA